jgi:hypothetical protein
MHRRLQFGTRENTASPRQHAPRAAVSSPTVDSHALDLFQDEPRSGQSETDSLEVVHLPLADTNEATGRTEQDTPQLLTVSQLARRLGVTCNWVYTHADKLGVYRLGKYLRFSWPRVLERLQR